MARRRTRGSESSDVGMTRRCSLEQAAGRTVACPGSACVFWEPGGAVLEGRCVFEHVDLAGRPEVAGELLRIRSLLESSASADADRAVRHLYHHLLNESEED